MSPFRLQNIKLAPPNDIKLDVTLQPTSLYFTDFGPRDIDLLNRYFSTKTMFDVKLACNEEARQVLQASLTDLPIRHAISSLKALREDLEVSGGGLTSVSSQSPGYDYGLLQYNMALRGLASNLSSSNYNGPKSALLCCQIFISIEQARSNYAAMTQHIIRGLSIMHEYRARPGFVAAEEFMPACPEQLPFLDVFIIKLFAAPCKFAVPRTIVDGSGDVLSEDTTTTSHPNSTPPCDLRTIAPDMGTELKRIAASTLAFFDKVARVGSTESARPLLSEKAALFDSLESWLTELERAQSKTDPHGAETLSISLMRLFHSVLKVILLGALDSSPGLYAKLRTENERLQGAANHVNERVRVYKSCI